MFNSEVTSGYTTTIALLALAFIFSPLVLIACRPVGNVSVVLAIAFSVLCVASAWMSRRKSTQLASAVAVDTREAH